MKRLAEKLKKVDTLEVPSTQRATHICSFIDTDWCKQYRLLDY